MLRADRFFFGCGLCRFRQNHDLLNTAKELKENGKSSAEIDAAAAKAQATLNNNLAAGEEITACENELRDCLVRVGAAEPEATAKDPAFLRGVSLFLYEHYGTNGFSELPVLAVKVLFAWIKNVFVK